VTLSAVSEGGRDVLHEAQNAELHSEREEGGEGGGGQITALLTQALTAQMRKNSADAPNGEALNTSSMSEGSDGARSQQLLLQIFAESAKLAENETALESVLGYIRSLSEETSRAGSGVAKTSSNEEGDGAAAPEA